VVHAYLAIDMPREADQDTYILLDDFGQPLGAKPTWIAGIARR
jgi:hypothetical protein